VWQGAAQEYSPQSQIPFVDAMLTQHVDGLVIVPTDADALQPSVTKAQSLRIPVVTVDTTVSDRSYLTAAITGDNNVVMTADNFGQTAQYQYPAS
jgi:ribose transport system substrate-binding protein